MIFFSSGGLSATDLADGADTVWVAETDGALRVLAADGTPLGEITDVAQVRAVDVDLIDESVWLLSEGDVYRYDFNGVRTGAATLGAPSSVHAAVAARTTTGGAWVAVESLLWPVGDDLAAGDPMDLGGQVRGLAHDPVADEV